MQAFLLLLDRDGQVVTRNELFDQCWGGMLVGDDSLNRAIAKVRRIASAVAPGFFEIETIPRTGYRLTGRIVDYLQARAEPEIEAKQFDGLSRRSAIRIGGAAAVLAGAGASWWIYDAQDRRFQELLAKGNDALYGPTPLPQAIAALERAVALEPKSARAWGLLAALRSFAAQGAPLDQLPSALDRAEGAAVRALSIDPHEPNALLAMYELQGSTLDWTTRDRRLRQIIALDPKNVSAIAELVMLLQAAGLTRESWKWNERAIALQPLSADFLGKRALKLWILNRVPQADKVADQLLDMYPSVPWVYWTRFVIYALTGRAKAAQALMNGARDKFPGPMVQLWGQCLPALDRPTPEAVAEARRSCVEASMAAA
jgi:tetratricopeptide (TPR) repeat protein